MAVLFQRAGEEIDRDDFIYIQSADLDWYSSEKAKQLLDKALNAGLITVDEDRVKAEFEFQGIDIPIDFEPDEDMLKDDEEIDLFSEMLHEVVAHSDLSRQKIMSLVNKKQDELDIEIKTALLFVTQEKDIDLPARDERIEKVIEDIRAS